MDRMAGLLKKGSIAIGFEPAWHKAAIACLDAMIRLSGKTIKPDASDGVFVGENSDTHR